MNPQASLQERLRSPDEEVRRSLALSLKGQDAAESREALYALLGDSNWRVRKTAAEALASDPPSRHAARLLDLIHSGDNAGLRNSAMEVLMRHGGAVVPDVLAHLAATDDDDVRIALLHLLATLRRSVALDALQPFLRSENKNVAAAAVFCVGRCVGADGYETLASFLRSDNVWLAFHAADALGELGDARALDLLTARYEEGVLRKSIFRSLGRLGDVRIVPFLASCLVERERLQLDALEALHHVRRRLDRLGDVMLQRRFEALFRERFPIERLEELLARGLKSPNPMIQVAAVESLGWLQSEKAVAHLILSLCEDALRPFAAAALGRIGSAASPALAAALDSLANHDQALAAAVETLGSIGGPEAVRPLGRLLLREDDEIRLAVIETLGRIESADVVFELMAQLGDPSPAARAGAITGLTRALARHPSDESSEALRQALDSEEPAVRASALMVYGRLHGAKAEERIRNAAKDQAQEAREAAVTLMAESPALRGAFLPLLTSALSDESRRVREAAARALAATGSPQALDKIKNLLDDEDMWVRAEAASAMGALAAALASPLAGDKERVSTLLLSRLPSEIPPVQIAILKALGRTATPAAADALLRAASEGQGETRLAAVEGLAFVPGAAARRRLEACLEEGPWKVSAAALESLLRREDAPLAKDTLLRMLLAPLDPLLEGRVIAGAAKLGLEEALPAVLGFLEQEQHVEEVGRYLRAMQKRAPAALEQAMERLSPRAMGAAELLLRAPAPPEGGGRSA